MVRKFEGPRRARVPTDELIGRMSQQSVIDTLAHGDIEVLGRMPHSSNATLLVNVATQDCTLQAIYKPLKGERPLWDFEPGLYRREIAAYELSEAMGFGIVPVTIERDGPYGEGSLQLFVDCDPREHYFSLFEERPDLHDVLRRFAVFDFVANNTDRKSGHILLAVDGSVWGIDHGVCFSEDFKLRTVVWEFGGEHIADELLEAVGVVSSEVPRNVARWLSVAECDAIVERARWLVEHAEFPVDQSGRRYPWPLV